MGKILILPDVHGRQFWKDACLNHWDEFDKIVFLGDYVSPYPAEEISNKKAIEVFHEVLDFKMKNPKKVVLLMGNHDFSYLNTEICECRTDFVNWDRLNEVYTDNLDLFDLAWETEINGKRYFFSHAGVRKEWLNAISGRLFEWEDVDKLPNADMFNNAFHKAYEDHEHLTEYREDFEYCIGIYSYYRGWTPWNSGSIVWADIREYGTEDGVEFPDVMFVCGHTQLNNKPIIESWVADLDVRRPFVLDTDTGKIEEYETRVDKKD